MCCIRGTVYGVSHRLGKSKQKQYVCGREGNATTKKLPLSSEHGAGADVCLTEPDLTDASRGPQPNEIYAVLDPEPHPLTAV